MKAISLWQPWASLIACGAKPFETRSWAPPRELIGQRIAIHAAKKADKDAGRLATDLMYGQHGHALADKLEATFDRADDSGALGIFGDVVMPAGGIVCTAVLDGAFQLGESAEGTAAPAARVVRAMTRRPAPECFTVRYDGFGNYAPGRWAWLLIDVRPVNPPAPARGAQGFFELPQGWLCGSGA